MWARKHRGWRGNLVLRLHRGPIQLQLREYLQPIPSTTTFLLRKCEEGSDSEILLGVLLWLMRIMEGTSRDFEMVDPNVLARDR